MPSESPSVWRAVFDHVVDAEKRRLGVRLQRDIANAWGITETLISTMRHESRKSHTAESFDAIDEGLMTTGRTDVWPGWTKRLYDLCHPPSPHFISEVRQHLDAAGFVDAHTTIRTSAGVITPAVEVKGVATVCRKVPVVSTDYIGDPAAIVHIDWQGRMMCCPDYAERDRKTFGLEMADDSMAPVYLPGDVVIVAPAGALTSGKQAAFLTSDQVKCQTFYQKDGYVEFLPKNPAYDRVTFGSTDELEWIYPVVGMVREELKVPTLSSSGRRS